MIHVAIVGAYGSAGSAAARELVDDPEVELTLIDDGEPGGGLCILRGCMPSKEVLSAGAHAVQARSDHRVEAEPEVDLESVVATKDDHVHGFAEHRRRAVHDLAAREDVEFLHGRARFVGEQTLRVSRTEGGRRTVEPDYVVIATGSRVNVPDLPGLEAVDYQTSADVLDAESLPDSGVAMGFGYVGLELAPYISDVGGTDLTVIEHDARPLDEADPEYGEEILSLYREQFGIEVLTHTHERRVEAGPDGGVRLHVEQRAPTTDGGGAGGSGSSRAGAAGDGAGAAGGGAGGSGGAGGGGGGTETGGSGSGSGAGSGGERESDAGPSPGSAGSDATAGDETVVDADELFLFTGRVPNVDDLGLEAVGLEAEPGWVEDTMQAADAERVFVVGDANGKEPILHVAKEQGIAAARNVLAHARADPLEPYTCVPHHVVFAALGVYPFVRLGHTAASARAAGIEHVAVTRAASDDGVFRTKDVPEGRATLVVGADGTVLGYQGLHHDADVMAKTMQVAVEMGLDVRELPHRAYHPTTPEILDGLFREAAAELE